MSTLSIANAQPISNNAESLRVNELIPQYLKKNAQTLIDFISDYYEWLSDANNASKLIDTIVANQDLDRVTDQFISGIKGEIAKNIPGSKVLDDRALLKKIVQYYKIKGSEMSVPTFFRIFYDEIVEVSYPKENLFKLSSGNWKQRSSNEDTILRGNYIGGTVELDNSVIGSYFNILGLYGDILGTAQLSSFTSIDETFDIALYDNDLQLRYDAHDAGTVDASTWTDKIQALSLNRNNDIAYNEYDNIFEFDGIDDSLSATSIAAQISISNNITVVSRFARRDNVTGDKDQCIFHLGNPDSPYQGIELYLNRISGALGKRINSYHKPVIVRLQVDEIELKYFDPFRDIDGRYYKMLSSYNTKEIYCKNPDNVNADPATLIDDVVQYDGDQWEIVSREDDLVLYESEITTNDDPSAASIKWEWKIPAGVDGEFSQVEKRNIIVDGDFLFHKISHYAILLYLKVDGDWKWQDVIYSNTPIWNFDYDSIERNVYVTDKVNSEVLVYELNAWNFFELKDTISGLANAENVAAHNGIITIGSERVLSSDYNSITSVDAEKVNGFSNYVGSDLLCFTNNGLSVNDEKIGYPYDNSNNDISFDSNGTQIAIGQNSKITLYEKTTNGFWTTDSNIDTDVSITITGHDNGSSEQIQWGPSATSYTTSNIGTVLLQTFFSGSSDDINVVENWEYVGLINTPVSNIVLDNDYILVGDSKGKEVNIFDLNDSYNLVATRTKQLASYGEDFTFSGDDIFILYQDNLDKINTRSVSDNTVDLDISPSLINTPINLNDEIAYTENLSVPVLSEDPKYYTVAFQGFRDSVNGFIRISVNGSSWETILQGDTSNHLNIIDSSSLSIGQNGNGQDFFSGLFTHFYYYNSLVSLNNVSLIQEYIEAEANDWYMLQFSNLEGTLVGVDRIEEISNTQFIFDSLSGYEVDAFWFLDSEPEVGGTLDINVTYGPTITKSQRVSWGDSTSQAFIRQNNGNRLRHNFIGPITGKYVDRKGWLSNNYTKLHDGDYYQEYSYVINPSISPSEWENEFLALVHPAGLKYIAALLLLIPRTNNWVGPNIEWDSATQKYIWNKPGDNFIGPYETKRPKWDLEWQKGLLPEYIAGIGDGYHSPIYQPGWLDDYQSMLMVIGGEMWPNGANAEDLERTNKLVRRLFNQLTPSRDERARGDYLQNLKFKDHYEISDYLYVPIEEAFDTYEDTYPPYHDENYPSLQNAKKKWNESDYLIRFSNFPSIINIKYIVPEYNIQLQQLLNGVDWNILTTQEQQDVINDLIQLYATELDVDPSSISIEVS